MLNVLKNNNMSYNYHLRIQKFIIIIIIFISKINYFNNQMKFIIPIFFLISACLGALEYNPPFNEETNNANWVITYPKLRATKFN